VGSVTATCSTQRQDGYERRQPEQTLLDQVIAESRIRELSKFELADIAPPQDITDALWAQHIRVRPSSKTAVRVCVHYYCNEDEIDRLLTGLQAISDGLP
jgi:selenocysteine lyase/cysteine desulfurase